MWRYKLSIFSGIILFGSLIAATCFFGNDPTIYAVGGLLFSIPLRLFWQSYMSPVLKIKIGDQANIYPGNDKGWKYRVNRIIVENSGRSAAKNCKGYIVDEWGKERICWTVPKERPNATINPKDNERLDFCAFNLLNGPSELTVPIISISQSLPSKEEKKSIWSIIAPTEEGWGYPWNCRPLNEKDYKVLITADNTEPVEAKIRFEYREKKIVIVGE